MLKTVLKFGYIFIGLWLIGGIVFAILDRISFSEALWLLLICLISGIPDKLAGITGLSEKIIVILFDILGMIFVGLLIGYITSFLVSSVIRFGKPLKKTTVHKLKGHIVFLGMDEMALSALKVVESLEYSFSNPILIITNNDDFVSHLPFISNLFLIKGDPLSMENWKLADLQSARGIYIACEGDACKGGTIDNGRKIYLELASDLIQQYLKNNDIPVITTIDFLNNETQLSLSESTEEVLQVFRERKISDYIVASNIVSDGFDKVIDEILLSVKTPSIFVKTNFKGYDPNIDLYSLKENLLKQNILLIGYIYMKVKSIINHPKVVLNPSVSDLKSRRLSDIQELILFGKHGLENKESVLAV